MPPPRGWQRCHSYAADQGRFCLVVRPAVVVFPVSGRRSSPAASHAVVHRVANCKVWSAAARGYPEHEDARSRQKQNAPRPGIPLTGAVAFVELKPAVIQTVLSEHSKCARPIQSSPEMRVPLRCDPCAIFGSTITGDAVVLCRPEPSVVPGAFALRRIGCTTCATQGFLQAYPLPGSRKTRGQLVSASFPAQDRLFQASAVRIRRKRRLARISVNGHFDDLGGQEPMVDAVGDDSLHESRGK